MFYFNVFQLLRQIADSSMLSVLLRHVQDLMLYYSCFTKIAKMLVKVREFYKSKFTIYEVKEQLSNQLVRFELIF